MKLGRQCVTIQMTGAFFLAGCTKTLVKDDIPTSPCPTSRPNSFSSDATAIPQSW